MDLTTSLIILGVVVLLDVALVRAAGGYFTRHPLEGSGVRPVTLFGKVSPLFTFLKIIGKKALPWLAGLARIKDMPVSALLLAAGAAGVAWGQVMRSQAEQRNGLSLALLFGGLALFAAGALLINNRQTVPGLLRAPAGWLNLRTGQVLLLAAGLGLSVGAAFLAGDGALMKHPVAAVACYLAGVAAVLAGAWRREAGPRSGLENALFWAAGLVLIALPFRVYSLSTIPRALTGDEGSFGMVAVSVIKGQINNIFATGWFSFPLVSFSVLSLPIRLLGQTTLALRITSALIGALTVGALYLLARRLFNHSIALLAALFLAVLHYHIHFSRLAINNIWDGLFYVVILGSLWAGWRDEKRIDYIIAGLALGFSQFFYASSRALVLLVPVYLVGLAIIDHPGGERGWTRLRRALPNLLLMGLIALTVFVPLGIFYLKHPRDFMAPMNRVSLSPAWFAQATQNLHTSTLGVLLDQFKLSLQAFTDVNFRMWYDSRTPMLLTIPAVLFLLGIVLILVRRQWVQAWMLGCWLGIISLAGALSQDTPAAQRYVAAAPAVALLVGFAVQASADLLRQLWPKMGRVWLALTVALMGWIGWREYHHYFIEYTPRSYFDENTLTANYLVRYLKDKPAGTELCFFGFPEMGYESINALPFLSPHIHGRDCDYPWTEEKPAPKGDAVFVFMPHLQSYLPIIQEQYPGGKLIEVPGINRPVLIWIYDTTPQ